MKLFHTILILVGIITAGCATTETNVRFNVRDVETKENLRNGRLILNRLSFFSNGAVGHGQDIDSEGTATINSIEMGSWTVEADVRGYDLAYSHVSLRDGGHYPKKGEWSEFQIRRLNPSFPEKKLEFSIETMDHE